MWVRNLFGACAKRAGDCTMDGVRLGKVEPGRARVGERPVLVCTL